MRRRMIEAVIARHLRDLIRDRRALIFILLVPSLVVVLFVTSRDELVNSVAEQARVTHKIVVSGSAEAPALMEALRDNRIAPREVADVRAEVERRRDLLGLVIPKDFESTEGARLQIVRRGRSFDTQFAQAAIQAAIDRFNANRVRARLREEGLPPSLADPIPVEQIDLATNEERTGGLLGEIAPFLVMSQIVGLMGGIAGDITAGEKERRTVEALLATPLTRREIVVAKWLVTAVAGATVGLITLLTAIGSFLLLSSGGRQTGSSALPPGAVSRAIIGVLILAFTVSAVQLTAGFFARSAQQANLFMAPLWILLIIPVFFLQGQTGAGGSVVVYAIPFLAPTLLMSNGLAGTAPAAALPVTMAMGLVVAGAAVLLADRVFRSERAIMRASG